MITLFICIYIEQENLLLFEICSKLKNFFLYLFLGNGFVGTISQFNVVSKSTYDANRNLYVSCNSEQIPSDLVDWNEFAYSSLINSYINVPSRCDGEFITCFLNKWPFIYFLLVRVSCYFDLSFTNGVLSFHIYLSKFRGLFYLHVIEPVLRICLTYLYSLVWRY